MENLALMLSDLRIQGKVDAHFLNVLWHVVTKVQSFLMRPLLSAYDKCRGQSNCFKHRCFA